MTDFGTDTSCLDSLNTGRLVSGPRLVAEACYRRLITPRGPLQGGEDEADYGFDIVQALGSAANANTAASLPGRIEAELLKDERLASVDVTVTADVEGPSVKYTIDIEGTTSEGPFALVLGINDVTIDIFKLDAGV